MKNVSFYLCLVALSFLLLATTCDEDTVPSCENRLESLAELGERIEELVSASQCGDLFECRSIAFGSKPCGGPWRYIVYSTSIDTLLLQELVEEYNLIEDTYNRECDTVSDCSVAIPPIAFECEDNTCTPVFN